MERYEGSNGIECIKAIEAALTCEEFRGFCKGNIIKYVWRESKKGFIADILKAIDYAEYLIEADLREREWWKDLTMAGDADITATELLDSLKKVADRGTDA